MEIGVEEIPAEHIQPASAFIENSFIELIKQQRLGFETLRCGSTPRRLALYVTGIPERQEDMEIVRSGPAVRIAYENGVLTGAGLGFLRKNNATEADAHIQSTDKGEFIAVRIRQAGQATADLLRAWLQKLPAVIPFPKKMIWNDPALAFTRPIRWWLLLWGGEVLSYVAGELTAGNVTFGNRFEGLGTKIVVDDPAGYFDRLKEHGVIADRQERKQAIRAQLENMTLADQGRVIIDEHLLETVTDLVEYPNACVATFDEYYLRLPQKIITSTINQNQKYFGVMLNSEKGISGDVDIRLSNQFVFISNGDPQHQNKIRIGNEKVVAARLADAMWYFDEDTKQPLEHYVAKLDQVVFQSELGTVAEKTQRIMAIGEWISHSLKLSETEARQAKRTALLSKADLVTLMLGEKEFTRLQGYIGMQYARASGEAEDVAQGIYEHYMPRGQNDRLPASITGAIVAVADKIDTVCGIIGIGMMPTGSADPFALRRAANGVVQIIASRGWDLDLEELIDHSLHLISGKAKGCIKHREGIIGFFRQRINWLLQQYGMEYDVIDSVMHIDAGQLNDLIKRAQAVQAHKTGANFIKLVIGFKRVSNIIRDCAQIPTLDEALLQDEHEIALHQASGKLYQDLMSPLNDKDYMNVLDQLVAFGREIDTFFDQVLVNCDSEQLRLNRYALLKRIRTLFLRVADLALIVVDDRSK